MKVVKNQHRNMSQNIKCSYGCMCMCMSIKAHFCIPLYLAS